MLVGVKQEMEGGADVGGAVSNVALVKLVVGCRCGRTPSTLVSRKLRFPNTEWFRALST